MCRTSMFLRFCMQRLSKRRRLGRRQWEGGWEYDWRDELDSNMKNDLTWRWWREGLMPALPCGSRHFGSSDWLVWGVGGGGASNSDCCISFHFIDNWNNNTYSNERKIWKKKPSIPFRFAALQLSSSPSSSSSSSSPGQQTATSRRWR